MRLTSVVCYTALILKADSVGAAAAVAYAIAAYSPNLDAANALVGMAVYCSTCTLVLTALSKDPSCYSADWALAARPHLCLAVLPRQPAQW